MRKLTIFITLLIIGFTLSSDDAIYIFDMTYSKEFVVPKAGLPSSWYYLYFRLPHPSTNEKLAVTTKYSENHDDYSMDICGYTKYPTDEELKSGSLDGNCNWLHSDYDLKDGEYTKFVYPFDKFSSGVTYIVIKMRMYSELNYLSVLVSPYKERQKMIMKAIEYDKELIIDSETLSNTDKYFIFNTESKNGNGESMTIKLHKDDVNDFMITLVGIKSLEDLTKNPPTYTDMRSFMSPTDSNDEGEYKKYNYRYTQIASETKYLYIMAMSMDNYELKYFSFTLNSFSSGLSLGIISLITILSLL